MAIRERNRAYWLITFLILFHFLTCIIWVFLAYYVSSKKTVHFENTTKFKDTQVLKSQRCNTLCFKTPKQVSKMLINNWLTSTPSYNKSTSYSLINHNNGFYIRHKQSELNILNYLKLSFRDIFFFESLLWLSSLFFTGMALVGQLVVRRNCLKVILFVYFTSFLHGIISINN